MSLTGNSTLDGILLSIFATLLSGLAAAIAWYLKGLRSDFKDFKKDQDEKICDLGDKLHELEIRISDKYVLKEDFLRNIAALEMKFEDGIKRIINTLNEFVERRKGETRNGPGS